MSNTPLKCIVLIVRRIYLGYLLDCPLLAIKTPFHPKSSRCSFSEYLYTKHFPKHALLDPSRRLHPEENEPPPGKVNRFRGKSRHFPRGWKCQVPPEVPMEPVPLPPAGESEPFSPESPALSPGMETTSGARKACGAGTPAGRGGKCTNYIDLEIPYLFINFTAHINHVHLMKRFTPYLTVLLPAIISLCLSGCNVTYRTSIPSMPWKMATDSIKPAQVQWRRPGGRISTMGLSESPLPGRSPQGKCLRHCSSGVYRQSGRNHIRHKCPGESALLDN